jgi:hypothetical protein
MIRTPDMPVISPLPAAHTNPIARISVASTSTESACIGQKSTRASWDFSRRHLNFADYAQTTTVHGFDPYSPTTGIDYRVVVKPPPAKSSAGSLSSLSRYSDSTPGASTTGTITPSVNTKHTTKHLSALSLVTVGGTNRESYVCPPITTHQDQDRRYSAATDKSDEVSRLPYLVEEPAEHRPEPNDNTSDAPSSRRTTPASTSNDNFTTLNETTTTPTYETLETIHNPNIITVTTPPISYYNFRSMPSYENYIPNYK